MLLTIPDVLTRAELLRCRELLEAASWRDGRATAGHVALRAKANQQLAHDDPLAQQLASFVLERLGTVPRFISAALPLRVLPPQFNRYADSGAYGNHIDNAIFTPPGGNLRIRSDLSATLFFSDPEHYKGGELVIDGEFGESRVKLPAGHMVLYSASTLHRVTPVTRGVRLAAFFWVQSMVREDHRRRILLELDDTIQAIGGERPDDPAVVRLTGIYHNLLRDWAAT